MSAAWAGRRYPPGYMRGWTPIKPRPSPEGMPWRLEADPDSRSTALPGANRPVEPVQVSVGFSSPTSRRRARHSVFAWAAGRSTSRRATAPARFSIILDVPVDARMLALQPRTISVEMFAQATLPNRQ